MFCLRHIETVSLFLNSPPHAPTSSNEKKKKKKKKKKQHSLTCHAKMETICIKCQILLSGKLRKNINLSSAELAQRVVKFLFFTY